ncbi:MAG: hypothetical protein IT368_07565, partial [Candidatus Hydrogenedentes bacterium]|nr:hypothetical protein [Candidatus Hydrogenedentota bacterium]
PLRRDEQRIFVLGAIFVALLAALVLGRHYVLLQPYELIEGGAANLAAAVALYKTRLLQHLAIWACFVVLWVLLEAAIVFQGWRGYRSLRAMLDVPEGRRPSRGGAAPLVVAVIAALLVARAAQAGPVAALEAAQADAMPYYNALYLLLRIAGAAWVAIEWVAAGILLRSFLLLRRAMEGGQ